MKIIRIGYARVSTAGQSLKIQRAALETAGCTEIFEDFATSGASNHEAEGYQALMARVETLEASGARVEVCVTKMDRFSRSLPALLESVHRLGKMGASFTAIDDAFTYDANSATSELMLSMIGAFAQFERRLIRSRMDEGRAAKAAKGLRFGRKPKLTQAAVDAIRLAYNDGDGKSPDRLAKDWGVSKALIGRILCIYPSLPPYVTLDEWEAGKKAANAA